MIERRKRRKRKKLKRLLMLLTSLIIVSASTITVKNLIISKKEPTIKGQKTFVEAKANVNDGKSELTKQENESNKATALAEDDMKKTDETVKKDDKDLGKKENTNTKPAKKSVNYKGTFSNAVFLGDSITEALSFYDIIDDSRVIACKGSTASKAMKEIDSVTRLKPKNIFILFGMNDILTTGNSEKFINNYTKLIDAIKGKLPNSNIYVQSILPVNPEVAKQKPRLTNPTINEFNKALVEMVKKENVNYINIASVLDGKSNSLHENDGIHYKYPFYGLWLDYLKNQIN